MNYKPKITISFIFESDFDLNKESWNLRSNFKPSNVLTKYVAKELDLWKMGKADWSLCFFVFRILLGSSTGDLGSGFGLLLVYLLPNEARISQWSHKNHQWSH